MAAMSYGQIRLRVEVVELITACVVLIAPSCYCQNIHTPIFSQQSNMFNISELTSIGLDVFTCEAVDDDMQGPAATLLYSIVGGSGTAVFSVGSSTCDVTLTHQLDFETVTQYDLVIQAADLDPINPLSSSATFIVNVMDVNEHDPIIINVPLQPISVDEDAVTGTTVFTCCVTDGDSTSSPSGQHAYTIIGGNTEGMFALDRTTCAMTLQSVLDFEAKARYDVTIEVVDLDPVSPRTAAAAIKLQVEDVNEKPTFKNLPGPSVFVPEDVVMGTVIFTCIAKDNDGVNLPRGQLTYRIMDGNGEGKFSVDSSACKVSVVGSLDFENQEYYELFIRAQDGDETEQMSVTRALDITVLDVNEHVPVFVNAPLRAFSVGERTVVGSAVFTCTAADQDSGARPSGQLRFSVTGGNEDGKFTLNDQSLCNVTLAQSLDFEVQSFYYLTLTVSDLDPNITFSSTQTFAISVVDENDSPSLQNLTSLPTVLENSPAGSVVFDCSATDQDDGRWPRGQLSYAIVGGNSDNAFTLTSPCRVATRQLLDHEKQDFYDLEIQVTDLDVTNPMNDTRVYRVKVTETNDNAPYFNRVPAMPVLLAEDSPVGIPFMNCSGDDDDTPLELTGQVRFEIIAGNAENYFAVDAATCGITLLKMLDYETQTVSFNISLRIHDLDPVSPRSAVQVYRFCVTNTNDNAPKWVTLPPKEIEITENAPLGVHLGNCSASDADTPLHPSSHIRYKIASGNTDALFYINP